DTPIEIEVQQDPPGNFISVKVKNRSSDIPKEALPKLFQKFKRLDDGLTRTTRGSGLGLFITKGLVEAMGGHIALHSEKGYFSVMMGFAVFEENRLTRP
ncbi:MAG: hypothetical protein K2X66_12490, partial [Cyanobacteria bacterium]|nr:hypothetical protein [Cyanobacteriota bacterium]